MTDSPRFTLAEFIERVILSSLFQFYLNRVKANLGPDYASCNNKLRIESWSYPKEIHR